MLGERELNEAHPPTMMRGRQATLMLCRSFEVGEDLGCVYGVEDIQALKCSNSSNAKELKRYNGDFRKLRLGVGGPMGGATKHTLLPWNIITGSKSSHPTSSFSRMASMPIARQRRERLRSRSNFSSLLSKGA